MFQAIPVQEDNIFAFKVMGKLTDEDYQKFLPELTSLIEQNGPISLLIELENFHGWDAKAAWDDFEFGKQHDQDFLRIAIVTENNWQKWLSKISGAFSNTFFEMKVKTFVRDDFQNAWDWLREGNQDDEITIAEQKTVMKSYSNISVAVDFSPHSELVLERAVELARHYNANLSLVHAIEHFTHMHSEYDSVMSSYDDAEMDQQLYENSVADLDKIANSLDYQNIRHEVLWGSPKSTILTYAAAQNVDLIVVGSHGRHGFARLLGSTSHAIVQNAKCDVIVVKLAT
ncbi:MAG: universal stress protein [Methylophaga sp.]|nr:universal stress protein [Methylophaga sp.]